MVEARTPRLPLEGHHQIVLLIPDEAERSCIAGLLADAGFEALSVDDPEDAARAARLKPLATVVDAYFLKQRGFQLIETLRVAGPSIPILMLADAHQEQLRLKALLMGVEDCVVRPCADQEFVLRLCRVVGKRTDLDHLSLEIQTYRDRSRVIRGELAELRRELHRNLNFLRQGVDFHRKLDPRGGHAVILQDFLHNLGDRLGVKRLAYLGLRHADASWYRALAAWGLPESLHCRVRIPAGGKVAASVQTHGAPILLETLHHILGSHPELSILQATGFTAVVPQITGSKLIGLVLLGEDERGAAPEEDALRLAEFLTSSLSPTLVEQPDQTRGLRASAAVVSSLVNQLESRDPYLQGHSMGVARISEELGLGFGLGQEDVSWLVIAATIHDVGRFESDASLWSKTGPLTDEDWDLVRAHPLESARLASAAGWPKHVVDAVRHHHERWDGGGYPFGLEKEDIPLFARIISIADGFDALTSKRSWRPQISREEALAELERGAGTRYDPEILRLLTSTETALKSAS